MLVKEVGRSKALALRLFGREPAYNADPSANGEFAFLRYLGTLPEISRYDAVIDVGANRGDWTLNAIGELGGSSIQKFYCVEPIPAFADQLRARLASYSQVLTFETALTAKPASEARLFEIGGGGRMYRDYRGNDRNPDAPATKESEASTGKAVIAHTVPATTGDALFHEIRCNPYFLKIDCDGHDAHILKGFETFIRERRPIIQFEYCDFWIGARSRLRDVCEQLYEAEYSTYKLFPETLIRFRYNFLFETYGYQNIIAAPRELPSFNRARLELARARGTRNK